VFPDMASDRQLHCMDLPGFWMDIGQPKGGQEQEHRSGVLERD
jgi:NDP-sugar pyrophosphorylase family protein